MFYKPSIAQPGVLRQDNAFILAHCGLKYTDHLKRFIGQNFFYIFNIIRT